MRLFILIYVIVFVVIIGSTIIIYAMQEEPSIQPRATIVFYPEIFYDAEGNRIPNAAVHALVRSQFVIVYREDSILLHENFPCSDLYTP